MYKVIITKTDGKQIVKSFDDFAKAMRFQAQYVGKRNVVSAEYAND